MIMIIKLITLIVMYLKIFLDVDGVLNSRDSKWYEGIDLCEEKIKILKRIVDKTNAKIVVSSTWRLHHPTYVALRRILRRFDLFAYSKTPQVFKTNGSEADRCKEIEKWLEENPGVSDYVIIDDDTRARIDGHYFSTLMEFGLTEEIGDSIIDHFKRFEEKCGKGKYRVRYSVVYETEIEVDEDEELDDVISDIEIPEDCHNKYVVNTSVIESIEQIG